MNESENPWHRLPGKPPFVLPGDGAADGAIADAAGGDECACTAAYYPRGAAVSVSTPADGARMKVCLDSVRTFIRELQFSARSFPRVRSLHCRGRGWGRRNRDEQLAPACAASCNVLQEERRAAVRAPILN